MGAKANIVIDQGADYSTTISVANNSGGAVDLTGYTGAAQIRKHHTSSTKYDFIVTFASPRSSGKVTLSMTAANTAAIEAGRYVYDLNLTSSANVTYRFVEGLATITPRVTR